MNGHVVPPARSVSAHTVKHFHAIFKGIEETEMRLRTINKDSDQDRTLFSPHVPIIAGMVFYEMYVFAQSLTVCSNVVFTPDPIEVGELATMCRYGAKVYFASDQLLNRIWRAQGGRNTMSASETGLLFNILLESRKVRIGGQPSITGDTVIVANPDKTSTIKEMPLTHPSNVRIEGADTFAVRIDNLTDDPIDSSITGAMDTDPCSQPAPPPGSSSALAFRIMCDAKLEDRRNQCKTTPRFENIGIQFLTNIATGPSRMLTITTDTPQGLFLYAWMDAFIQGFAVESIDANTMRAQLRIEIDGSQVPAAPIPTLFSMIAAASSSSKQLRIADPKDADALEAEIQKMTPGKLQNVLEYMCSHFDAM